MKAVKSGVVAPSAPVPSAWDEAGVKGDVGAAPPVAVPFNPNKPFIAPPTPPGKPPPAGDGVEVVSSSPNAAAPDCRPAARSASSACFEYIAPMIFAVASS